MQKVREDFTVQIDRIDHTIKFEIEGDINKNHKEQMGQFFTPGNVIDMMLDILEPRISDTIVDPSSGCGNILLHTHNYFLRHFGSIGENVNGIELDESLINISNQFHNKLKFDSNVIQCNTLQFNGFDKSVDIIIGNPPFGRKLNSDALLDARLLNLDYPMQGHLKLSRRIEILFLQKCVGMLKNGGKMGLILPDGVLGNSESMEVRKWLLTQGKIIAVIDLPIETFLPYTSVKTSVIFFQKTSHCCDNYKIFMAIADTCGHDRRGNRIIADDISHISEEYKNWYEGK